jgi:hypothetical protein
LVAVPLTLAACLFAAGPEAGVAATVLLVGAGAATATYVKNKTDRHNAAVEAGEITVPPDPRIRTSALVDMSSATRERLNLLGFPAGEIGRVERFEGGWLVERSRRGELAVVVGDDGGIAYYDPRWVPDVRAATEYLAGRGREPQA